MKAGIEVTLGVSASPRSEAARLQPQNAVYATVNWPLPPDDGEETILPDVVAALSHALAACGSVAFRYDDPLEGATLYQPGPRSSIINRVLDIVGLGAADSFGLVVSNDPATIAAMFEYGGWTLTMQMAVVFDPSANPAPILTALRGGLDWRERTLPESARLLFGPGHDGDFAVVAAANTTWLERFKDALR
jgi:hypothetical protein